jgi:hypothetical protein
MNGRAVYVQVQRTHAEMNMDPKAQLQAPGGAFSLLRLQYLYYKPSAKLPPNGEQQGTVVGKKRSQQCFPLFFSIILAKSGAGT